MAAKKTTAKTTTTKKTPVKAATTKKPVAARASTPSATPSKDAAPTKSAVRARLPRVNGRGLFGEFREFINHGNVVDLAVAFVMGATFKTVIDSLAGTDKQAGILGGLIGAIFGGDQPDFSRKVVTLNGSDIPLGAFVTASINFILVSAVMFLVVKAYNRFRESGRAR